jgi:hypothetical protein
MRLLPARDLLRRQARGPRLAQLAASIALSACTVGPAGSYNAGNAADPSLTEPASEDLDAAEPEPSVPDHDQDADTSEDERDGSVGEAADLDAGTAQDDDAQADADSTPTDRDSERSRPDRCQRGARSTITLSVEARVDRTVATDSRFIYYRSLVNENPARHEINALPRAQLADPTPSPTQTAILRDDYALGPLVDGGDPYLFFIAMPRGDETNQGLFRVQKRERAGIESLPVHAQASDDYWPGQLAVDESAFYLASSGPSSRSLRILRFARTGYQREVLWSSAGEGNDDSAVGGLSLREGDIAVDANYIYFTLRVNQSRPPHDFRVYRLSKQGPNQTPLLVTTLTESYGALASDGTHLFFSDQNNLEQLHLASGTRERLARQESMRDLSYADGVLSWTPVARSDANLVFFCL